ncbi:MAG: hypothetical protein NC225_08840 [Clostridium sp.]|nr:hypothetical protein [Clostridium sp.]MCM1460124.1 hypothetical protein [Bacteroides sp.]
MNRKKWTTITIISLIVLALEIVAVFVVILPSKNLNDVFKALEEGNPKKAEAALDKLSDKNEDKAEELMDDFATYQCNQYAQGAMSYDKLHLILQSIDALDDYYGFSNEFHTYAASKEIIRLCDAAYEENNTNGKSASFYEYQSQVSDIYYSLNEKTGVDQALKDFIDEKYKSFSDGSMSFDEISAYMDVASYILAGDASYYAIDMQMQLSLIEGYQEKYDTAKKYYDDKKYFEAIEECDNAQVPESDVTGFYDKFKTLRQDAYDAGKTYYVEEAENLANANDYEGARDIINNIKNVYGDEVDTSELEALIVAPWMEVYAKYMKNMEKNLKRQAEKGVKIGDCDDSTTINVDDYMPNKIYLHDFDNDGIPEMLLTNDSYAFIVGYNGERAVLTGFVQAATFCDAPYLITIPTLMPDEHTGYALIKLENCKWSVEEYYYAANDGSKYIVNGSEVDYDTCNAEHDKIAGYENKDVEINYGDYIENYEDLIYGYK